MDDPVGGDTTMLPRTLAGMYATSGHVYMDTAPVFGDWMVDEVMVRMPMSIG